MDELYTLDYVALSSDPLNLISPIQALIFLFKWTAGRESDDIGEGGARGPKTGGVYDPEFAERGGFYAKQVSQSEIRRNLTILTPRHVLFLLDTALNLGRPQCLCHPCYCERTGKHPRTPSR